MRATTSLTLRFLVVFVAVSQMVSAQGPQLGRPILGQPVRVDPMRLPARDEVSRGAFVPNRTSQKATLHGIVQNHLGELVPLAGIVLLRSLVTGEVVAQAKVTELATFVVRGFDPGAYAAELIAPSTGRLIAASEGFTAGNGEVIRIAPIIPNDAIAGVAQLLSISNAATASVINSAISAGVLAVEMGLAVSP